MLFFWILIAVLTVTACAWLAWPLLRPASSAAETLERARRLAIYRDRRREIEADRDAGRLDAAAAEAAIDELAREAAALPDVPPRAGDTCAPAANGPRPWLAGMLVLGVAAAAIVVYLRIGTPGIVGIDVAKVHGGSESAQLDAMVEELGRRAQSAPGDAEAWTMLAHARRLQGDLEGALTAFEKALGLRSNDAKLIAEYAETIAASRDGDFSGQPIALLERALAADPKEPKALAMMGAAQFRTGNATQALRYLRDLLAVLPAGSQQATEIQAVVDRLVRDQGPAPAATATSPPAAVPGAAISGSVRVADALRSRVPGSATLFVSARAPEGPRTPYAAMRSPFTGDTIAFKLEDAQAMSPDRTLSTAKAVVVEARISRSGDAIRRSGDLIGASAVVSPGVSGLEIVIDKVVE